LAEGKAGELDERVVDFDRCAARDAGTAVARPVHLNVGVGTQHAVFGGGAGIFRQVEAGTNGVPVPAVGLGGARATLPERVVVDAAVQIRVEADRTADLDAGVGARDVPETGAVK